MKSTLVLLLLLGARITTLVLRLGWRTIRFTLKVALAAFIAAALLVFSMPRMIGV